MLISDLIDPFKVVITKIKAEYFFWLKINFWTLPGEKVPLISNEPSLFEVVFIPSKSFILTPDNGSWVVLSTIILLKVYSIGSWLYKLKGVPNLGYLWFL